MNPTVEAVKRNLDLTSSKPLKICTYEAFKTIILGIFLQVNGLTKRIFRAIKH